MPVFFLSLYALKLSWGNDPLWESAWVDILLAFAVWHLFIYPASNSFNSYNDKDTESIGDIKNPLKIDSSVLIASCLLNLIGLSMALYIDFFYFVFVLVYVVISSLYSWRPIRLKRYPWLGFFIIFFFQGYWIVVSGYLLNEYFYYIFRDISALGLAASFMFGGGYPITQIYQHKQDKEDGVITISMLLGIKGTLVFSGIMNAIGLAILGYVVIQNQGWHDMALYLLILSPSFYYFSKWSAQVFKDERQANYENVMRMTWISAICNNIAILMLILKPHVINWLP